MRKKKVRVLSALLCSALTATSMPVYALGFEPVVLMSEGNSTQTSSEPETVWLNSYNGSERTQNFNENWKFNLGDVGGAVNRFLMILRGER